MMKRICLGIILIFYFQLLPAQQYTTSLEKFTIESGLSHNQINWICKDKRGMIWVGAYNGINRYDGQEFKFVAEVAFMNSYNSNKILEDQEGDLWLKKGGSKTELIFFNTITEKVKTLEEKFGQNFPIKESEFETAIQLANQSIVICTKSVELILISPKGKVLQKHQVDFEFRDLISHPSSNQFWLFTSTIDSPKKQLTFFDEKLKPQFTYQHNNVLPALSLDNVTSNNNLEFMNGQFIYTLTPQGVLTQREYELGNFRVFDNETFSIEFEKEKDLFFNVKTGEMAIFDFKKQSSALVSKKFKELNLSRAPNRLANGSDIWFASVDGLIKLQIKKSSFKKALYKSPKQYPQKEFIAFRGITADPKGNIIANGDGVCYRISDSTIAFKGLQSGGRKNYDVFFDNKGNRWFNDKGYSLYKDAKTGEEKMVLSENKKNENKILVWNYFQDKNGRIWSGTYGGLFFYEEGFSMFKRYHPPKEFESINGYSIYHIFQDREERMWLLTAKGLYLFDSQKGILERYWKGGKGKYFFPTDDLRHIHQDTAGIFWIASREGLLRWDKEKSETRLFTTHDGLPHNVINAVFEDDFGFLWMSSDNGITQFQKSTLKIKNYTTADGITYPEFNRISHFKDKNGNIYFGGLNGVTYFHPKDFVESFNAPLDIPLVLTECKIFSNTSKQQESRLDDFYKNKKITLSPDDKYLTLQFALLDYKHSKPPQYVFEIDGEKWSVTRENSINISSLPYGKHTLTVKGRTGNGLFSNNTLTIPIEVLKPFYLQSWFIGLSVLGFVLGLVFYQKRKTKRFEQREEELEKKVSERTETIQEQKQQLQNQAEELLELNEAKSKFLANISHEFRTPLTLITNTLHQENPNEFNRGNTFTFEEIQMDIMKRNANRLQQLIDQLLELSKSEAGQISLRAREEDFHQYFKELVLSFQPFAKNKNITLNFHSEEVSCPLYFERNKMDKVIYNLLGNAIKFTSEGGIITINLQKQNEAVIFKIKDSGIGIPKEELPNIFDRFYRGRWKDDYAYEGTGLGLALVKEFIEIHHGKIEVESKIEKGTCFTIHLPIGDAHLSANEKVEFPLEELVSNPIINSNSSFEKNQNGTPIDSELPLLLIIEDNEDLLIQHQHNFKNDYQLLLAKDGQQGVDLAIEHLPDLIVCDVMMPKKNGYEVCQLLKLDERTNHIPILLLTAKAGHSDKMEGLMVGADVYLTKPYEQNELAVRLQNLLVSQKHLQQKLIQEIQQQEPDTTIKTPQQQFLQKCKSIVEENYTNPNFDVDEWGRLLEMSRSNLFRKIKSVLGTSPMQFLRSYRLAKAKELLIENAGNGSEIAYMVGFNNPNYFFKCFKEEYGMTVGDFVRM